MRRQQAAVLRRGQNATALLQRAIDDCGSLPGGGTVLVPKGLTLLTGSLFKACAVATSAHQPRCHSWLLVAAYSCVLAVQL